MASTHPAATRAASVVARGGLMPSARSVGIKPVGSTTGWFPATAVEASSSEASGAWLPCEDF